MKKLILGIFALAMASGGALWAQNMTGSWQGSLALPPGAGPQGRPPLRIVFRITHTDDEKLKAVMYSIDQGGQPIPITTATQQGTSLKLAIAAIGGGYEGKLNAEGDLIVGTWTQGGVPMPLTLVRATPATEWTIPKPPPPPKTMSAGAKPSFDVATIKPSAENGPGTSILVGRGGSNLFTTTNTTLNDLIVFAYGFHPRQIVGSPAWTQSDRYDITAKPDQPGMPNVTQLQSMLQKLLTERFQLTFHRDKKELSVYSITVAKTGLKLTKSDSGAGSLPGMGGRGPGNIVVRNATMADFAGFLQSRVLDRPVVDQTALGDRYDFTLLWTPDASMQAPSALSTPPPAAAEVDAPPDLFTAVQRQLGLKLDATRAPVEVMVIDRVEKPSAN